MNITLIAKPDNRSQNISIDELPFLIGRDESPFAQLREQSREMNKAVHHISRRHATIYENEGKILIRDLGSKNGTKINGRKLKTDPVVIENGDSLRITKKFEYSVKIERPARVSKGVPFSLTLIPADSQSGLKAIDITTYPFYIGRKEHPFQAYESTLPEHIMSLSHKHARITYQDNQIFLEDLGSTNGTTLSGERLGRNPTPMNNGDHILFGQYFKYIVRLIGEDVEETIALESETIKEPDRTVIIDSKNDSIESMGTGDSQGKFLLDEIAARPDSGKNVVFVKASQGKASTPDQSPVPADHGISASAIIDEAPVQVDETGSQGSTVYMSSATQFLKILTPDDKKDGVEADTNNTPGYESEKSSSVGGRKSRIMGLIREIYSTLAGTPVNANRRKWFAAGVVAIILCALVFWLAFSRMPEQKLKRLMAAGQYLEYLKLSDQVLAKDPYNEDIRRASTDALMRGSLTDFAGALEKGSVESANEIIGSYGAYSSNNPDSQKALKLLNWIVDLESYFIQNDPDKPINLFRDEAIIEPLVTRWDINEDDYRFMMDQMVQRSDAFETTRNHVYHHLNVLKLKSIYFDSVKELNRTIQTKIDGERIDEIIIAIEEYKRKRPETEGLSELRREAEQFQKLDRYIRARDVIQISTLLQQVQFQTPVFKEKVEDLKKNILPDPDLGSKMAAAAQDWAIGNTDQAFIALESLANERWGDLAEAKLNHYRQVLDLVAKVNSTRGTAEHSTHLLTLRRALDPEEDQFYAKLVEEDYVGLRDHELQKSQRLMDKAAKSWAEYLESGRITGLLRLESTVSKKFSQRANYLKLSFEQSRSGVQIYKTLDIQLPAKWEKLNSQVTDEVIAQRLRIEDLSGVLGPEVSTAKLALLPSP